MGLTYGPTSANQTYWLPVEPEEIDGLNNSPVMLVVCFFTPEIFVLISYMALCWLAFAAFIDAHHEATQERDSKITGAIRFRCFCVMLILL